MFAEIILEMEIVDWFRRRRTNAENIAFNVSSVVLLFGQAEGGLFIAIGEVQIGRLVFILVKVGDLIAKDMGLVAEFHSK